MGNILRDQCRFFSLPAEFVESGCLCNISPSAVKLYVALYFFAQKHSAVRLEFSNAQLQTYAGLDPKSIQSARELLCTHRLIRTSKGALGIYSYVLLNPGNGEPLPPPVGRTGTRRYHSPAKEQSHDRHEPSLLGRRTPLAVPEPVAKTGEEMRGDGDAEFHCYACKGRAFWTRGTYRICVRCHPDSLGPVAQREICSPTASEVGF
jgi:hypothetical protein